MNLLLDTHVLLWWLDDYATLSKKAKDAVTVHGFRGSGFSEK